MSIIATAVKHLIAAGVSGDDLVRAITEMEESLVVVREEPALSKRQERNKRYYERLKASENRLNKTNKTVSDGEEILSSPEGSSPTPPSPNPLQSIPPSPPKGGSSPTDRAIEVFSDIASKAGLPVPRKVTADRRRKIEARVREHGEETWAEACRRMASSAFCRGENDRGWRADLDFLCQPKSFNGLIEGKYDDRPTRRAQAPPTQTAHQQRHQAAVEAFSRHRRPQGAPDDEFTGPTIDLADRDFRPH